MPQQRPAPAELQLPQRQVRRVQREQLDKLELPVLSGGVQQLRLTHELHAVRRLCLHRPAPREQPLQLPFRLLLRPDPVKELPE